MEELTLAEQQLMVARLRDAMQSTGQPVQLFETHISWVLVGELHAYKIKKAVRLDFLDCSALAARLHFCHEELRLNRRLAPRLYEAVEAITGTACDPQLDGAGPAIDYAVRMQAFSQEALWSERIGRDLLEAQEIDQFAQLLAHFHMAAAQAPPNSRWTDPVALRRAGEDNMAQLAALASPGPLLDTIAALRDWRADEERRLWHRFAARKRSGFVRECHGDLHCGNILTLDGEVTAFDCIEFDPALRWIDVMHELAFPVMNLRQRHHEALAARLLNAYLERTGDYEGLGVLRYYHVECALVRAKIALLRARQLGGAQARQGAELADSFVAEANAVAHPARPMLIVMHGFSGSGKSTVARRLVELFSAVQVRSDVERKRMHGIGIDQAAGPEVYGRAATGEVYARLRELAGFILDAGFPVVIDACNLKRQERAAFAALAAARSLPWLIVDVPAGEALMRERIRRRLRERSDPSDADEAVLAMQMQAHEPLSADELARTVTIDSEAWFDARLVQESVRKLAPVSSRPRGQETCPPYRSR